MEKVISLLRDIIGNVTFRDFIDIIIIAVLVYHLMKYTRHTQVNQLLKGIAIVIIASWASEFLRLTTLHWLLNYVLNYGVIVAVVIFQPEIRRLLENIGRGNLVSWASRLFGQEEGIPSDNEIAEQLFDAIVNLSRTRTGALILVEQKDSLDPIIKTGTPCDAKITANLIENIFYPNTPLHDGAMIIRDGRIHSAACILPLTERTDLPQAMGTRHRAAIGASEAYDAWCIVVSEERGTITIVKDGEVTEDYDSASLRAVLKKIFVKNADDGRLSARRAAK